MGIHTTLNGSSNQSILSIEARARARLTNARKQENTSLRSNRRRSIHGALEGILGESLGDDWSLYGENFYSSTSQQSAPSAPNHAASGSSSETRYRRRGSVTKFSLDPSAAAELSHAVPTSIKHNDDDEISLCRQMSEDNSNKSSNNTQRRYGRPGSITKYSIEPAIAAAKEAVNHDDTSLLHSRTSHSSFPEMPSQSPSTIDSLPIPMKKQKKRKSTKSNKKSRDSISKYSKSLHKEDDKKKRSSKLGKNADKALLMYAQHPDSPDTTIAEKGKKKKKELKLRKDKEDEKASLSTATTSKDEASTKRRQKRRCSVTKYNLLHEVERQMDSGFSGPILPPPVEPEPETTQPPPSSPRRHHRRRTSVTAYTPGIMEAAEKSPGVLKRSSVTAYTPGMKYAVRVGDAGAEPKQSLEVSKHKNFPAAA